MWAVIDRATNNILGEYATQREAEAMLAELAARDPNARSHVEVVQGHAMKSHPPLKMTRITSD